MKKILAIFSLILAVWTASYAAETDPRQIVLNENDRFVFEENNHWVGTFIIKDIRIKVEDAESFFDAVGGDAKKYYMKAFTLYKKHGYWWRFGRERIKATFSYINRVVQILNASIKASQSGREKIAETLKMLFLSRLNKKLAKEKAEKLRRAIKKAEKERHDAEFKVSNSLFVGFRFFAATSLGGALRFGYWFKTNTYFKIGFIVDINAYTYFSLPGKDLRWEEIDGRFAGMNLMASIRIKWFYLGAGIYGAKRTSDKYVEVIGSGYSLGRYTDKYDAGLVLSVGWMDNIYKNLVLFGGINITKGFKKVIYVDYQGYTPLSFAVELGIGYGF